MNGHHVMTSNSETSGDLSGIKSGLNDLGIRPALVHANLSPAALIEMAVHRGEGQLTETGALNALTGSRTGRSPKDRFIVPEAARAHDISWGPVNQRMATATFDHLIEKTQAHFHGRELFIHDGAACADPAYRLGVRVVAEKAWHALFAHDLFLRLSAEEHIGFTPDLTI